MKEKIEVFGHTVLKLKVPSKLFESVYLKEDTENMFSSQLVLSRGANTKEQRGLGYSTCPLDDNFLITDLRDIFPLFKYITDLIKTEFYCDSQKEIFYLRIWANKIFKHCSGICHVHDNPGIDGVAIFYLNSPKNSGKFIILEKNIKRKVTEKYKDISHHVEVMTGDLIIHKSLLPHAVSEHMNDDPRICFVFEFGEKK